MTHSFLSRALLLSTFSWFSLLAGCAADDSATTSDPGCSPDQDCIHATPRGSTGTGGGGAGGATGACSSDADCLDGLDGLEPLCVIAHCRTATCDLAFLPKGTTLPDSTTGDCQRPSCDGAGRIETVPSVLDVPVQVPGDCQLLSCSATGAVESNAEDSDTPSSTGACSIAVCNAGVPSESPADAGAPCAETGVCNGAGACGVCLPGATMCSDAGKAQVCLANGQWADSQECGNLGCASSDQGTMVCNTPTQITVGETFSCALLSNGTVRCWGTGNEGELGCGPDLTSSVKPLEVPGLTKIVQLIVGSKHACALSLGGEVKCWGSNELGQLGVGDATVVSSSIPVHVMYNGTALYGGWNDTCVRDATLGLKCWGSNKNNLSGTSPGGLIGPQVLTPKSTVAMDPSTTAPFSIGPLAGCTTSIDLSIDNDYPDRVHCWGTNSKGQVSPFTGTDYQTPQVLLPVSGATKVSVGTDLACALLADGHVTCWGKKLITINGVPQTTISPPSTSAQLANIVDIQVGAGSQCALSAQGALFCWGDDSEGQIGMYGDSAIPISPLVPTLLEGFDHITSFAVSKGKHSCFLSDGVAYCMGSNMGNVMGSPNGTGVGPRKVVW